LSNTFSSDLRQVTYTVAGMKAGTVIEEITTKEIANIMLVNNYYLRNDFETMKFGLKITYPKALSLKFNTLNKTEFLKTDTLKNGSGTTVWIQNTDTMPRVEKSYDLSAQYVCPMLVIQPLGYKDGDKFISLFSTVQDFKNYYKANYLKDYSYDIHVGGIFFDTLFSGKSNFEKMRAAAIWVKKNVKYVSYTEKNRGFTPEKPDSVFKSRTGDCKGMSMLLRSFLAKAGVESSLCVVGTDRIKYQPSEIPVFGSCNHMVVVAFPNGKDKPVVLDCTHAFDDPGFSVPSSLQGKELLCVEREPAIIKLPFGKAEQTTNSDSCDVSFTNLNLDMTFKRSVTNYLKHDLVYTMIRVLESDSKKPIINQFFTNQWPNGSADLVDYESNIYDDKPLKMKVKVSLPNYLTSLDDKLYFKPRAVLKDYNDLEAEVDTSEKMFLHLDYAYTNNKCLDVQIPNGFKLQSMPENVKYYSPLGIGLEVSYKMLKPNVIRLSYVQKSDFGFFDMDKILEYNKAIAKIEQLKSKLLVFVPESSK